MKQYKTMSKEVQSYICIDDNVTSVKSARDMVERAWFKQKALKGELWGLIMATPKDITPEGEDPITNVNEKFENIWDELWDAFVDEYKYATVADDAEFNDDSLVQKAWDDEIKSLEELREEERQRSEFFEKYRGVVSPYNFDDYRLYEEFKKGNIIINEPFTVEQRNLYVRQIEENEKNIVEKALKRLKLENGEEKSI